MTNDNKTTELVDIQHGNNTKEEITLTKESVLRQFKQLSDDHELIPWLSGAIDTLLTHQKQIIMDMCDEMMTVEPPCDCCPSRAIQDTLTNERIKALSDLKERISKEI